MTPEQEQMARTMAALMLERKTNREQARNGIISGEELAMREQVLEVTLIAAWRRA